MTVYVDNACTYSEELTTNVDVDVGERALAIAHDAMLDAIICTFCMCAPETRRQTTFDGHHPRKLLPALRTCIFRTRRACRRPHEYDVILRPARSQRSMHHESTMVNQGPAGESKASRRPFVCRWARLVCAVKNRSPRDILVAGFY
jgi:hypothetical protein